MAKATRASKPKAKKTEDPIVADAVLVDETPVEAAPFAVAEIVTPVAKAVTPIAKVVTPIAVKAPPPIAEVRRRAYELYVAGGRNAFDNWVRAEQELRA
jgi:hypothetical protein